MVAKKKVIDKVRASRDGHEYHEMWVARKSLELLNPNSKLKALAVEGLSPVDQKSAKSEEVEIADVTLYYGGQNFQFSEQVSIIQFKYSVAKKNIPITLSDAKKTIEKFSEAYKNHINRFGKNAPEKLRFQFITNRPISQDLVKAIKNLANGVKNHGKYLRLQNQFKNAANLQGIQLQEFASICDFLSYTKHLSLSKSELENTLISLSATSDSLASSRLGKLKELVRDKAGTSSDGKNIIEHTDVFAALGVREISDLLPCPEALPTWGQTLLREQTNSTITAIANAKKPVLIHATGGIGKTVFMKILADSFSKNHEVVFFDSFGGGSYRSTEYARHLAKHGLIHIANTLSFRGLCDPILPNTPDEQALAKTFRNRLEQCLDTLKIACLKKNIYIFIDAIDNAEFAAKQSRENPFSRILIESLHEKPINGVTLIVSCRTERKPDYAKFDEIKLNAFTKREATEFIQARTKSPSSKFIDLAFSRSGGNARLLDYFIESKNNISGSKSKLKLDDFLSHKIDEAIESAARRGSLEKDLTTFLSGLTLLAPPVSIDDCALTNKVDAEEISSMISDLAPLLELTKHGVIFKDEPTETLIIDKYGSKTEVLNKIANNLKELQGQSVFAAKTLPDLLYKLKDEKGIYSLAEDNRIPSSIESDVGKLKIKYARLKVAAKHAADKKDFDKLVGFLVGISSIVEFDQRGLNYLLSYPDLVVMLNDSDAIRRIYEARTEWPGRRLACLGIIHTLKGELEEAHQYVDSLREWVDYYLRMNEKNRFELKTRMNAKDCVAVPLFNLADKNPKEAARYFQRWKDWYSFEIAKQLYRYIPLAIEMKIISKEDVSLFHNGLENAGALLAALFFYNYPKKDKSSLFKKLASLLNKRSIDFPDKLTSQNDTLFQKCFLYAALGSFKGNDKKSAKTILDALSTKRPRVYTFSSQYNYSTDLVEFMLREVIESIITGKELSFLDVLPDELFALGKDIKYESEQDFLNKLKEKVEAYINDSKEKNEPNIIIRARDKHEIDAFLSMRLPLLHSLAISVRNLLNSPSNTADTYLEKLIEQWESISINQRDYQTDKIDHVWLTTGYELTIFSLFTLDKVKEKNLKQLLISKYFKYIGINFKAKMVQTLAALLPNSDLTEKTAYELSREIEIEDAVTTKATYYADVSQSLLLVNKDEAIEYFKKGLLSTDAIGSEDYRYVNELLIFAASFHGKEMNPSIFHTLNNICELNMSDEPHKFYWGAYGAAFSKIAGLRNLAQLSRWDDRQKIDLSHTLLPSLISLVRDKKISPKDALTLNYLASPAEYYSAGTCEFAKALSSAGVDSIEVKELIRQFTLNNSGLSNPSTIVSLTELSEQVLGSTATETIDLKNSLNVYSELIDKKNRHNNLPSSIETNRFKTQQPREQEKDEEVLLRIIDKTDPTSNKSLKASLKKLNKTVSPYNLKDFYFSKLRKKINYKDRKSYIENLASIEDDEFNLFWTIEELNRCHEEWGNSSISIRNSFKKAGLALLHQNSIYLIGDDHLSHKQLNDISKFSGVSIPDLTLELIKVASQYDVVNSGTVWLSLATFLNTTVSNNIAQQSLNKLLEKESTKLSELMTRNQYKAELYPTNNTVKILAGLTWKTLGSYNAKERWRASYAIRCFAKFNRWDVISELISLISKCDAGAFQCPDIEFYHYHARLWLLISLARIAIDQPDKVAMYEKKILPFTKVNHVLIRHFAASILLECHKTKKSLLTATEQSRLNLINKTRKPLVDESNVRAHLYQERPRTEPEPDHKFYLEYDFRKLNVVPLGSVFNLELWKVDDLISESALEIDPNISSHNDGSKSISQRHNRSTPEEETYGEHVGWHAMFIAAGKLLSNHSVTKSYWSENSWDDWLSNYLLSREDGFWESDALDIIPLEIKSLLLEEKKGKLVLTEDRDVLLGLVNLENKPLKDIVIDGHWVSKDGITVNISSALVSNKVSKKTVTSLRQEGPFHVWLPVLSGKDESDSFSTHNDSNLTPWIVSLESYRKLDKLDPYGADISRDRSRITKELIERHELQCTDQFQRYWLNKNGDRILKSEIWRGPTSDHANEEYAGIRLSCSSDFLKQLLKDRGDNLIVLIHLRQYLEQSYSRPSSEFFHSVGIVEINEKLEIKYFKGRNSDD